jgi:16S rRNA (uracil1498-N3)-methyltransferase
MQQCGRSTYIEFGFCSTISEFVKNFPDVNVFDFCDNFVENYSDIKTVLIGCEGGFSSKERENLLQLKRFKLDTPMVLRSESATLAVASKILL